MIEEPEDQDLSTEALEQELQRVKAELEEYQGLIEELPSIYEGKFHHQLRDVAQDIRRLLDERQALQRQIDHALEGGPEAMALPEATTAMAEERRPDTPFLDADEAGEAPAARNAQPRLILLSALTMLAVAGLVGALGLWIRSRAPQLATPAEVEAPAPEPAAEASAPGPDAETPAATPSPGSLRLRARGDCWVEVQTLDGRRLFMGMLIGDEERSLALGEGLRLLAGRPDLLEVAAGTDDFRTLGSIEAVEWTTFVPPAAPERPAS